MSGKGFKKWWKNFAREVKYLFWDIKKVILNIIFTPLKDWILLLKLAGVTFVGISIFYLIHLFFEWLF